jgi:7-keto-8-aminopelargonate synthetase-like enzyme
MHVLNLASYSFRGLSGNETIEFRVMEALQKYGFGSCGPLRSYATIGLVLLMPARVDEWLRFADVHMDLFVLRH